MRRWQFILGIFSWVMLGDSKALAGPVPDQMTNSVRSFMGQGVVMDLKPAEDTIVIRHEAIGDYMGAMTMPFKVRNPAELAGLSAGDKITFRLQVNDTESRVDEIVKTGVVALPPLQKPAETAATPAIHHHPLLDYKFTNELSQAVSINDFRGQAVAITFFTRAAPCPIIVRGFRKISRKPPPNFWPSAERRRTGILFPSPLTRSLTPRKCSRRMATRIRPIRRTGVS